MKQEILVEWNSLAISLHWLEYNNEVYEHVIGLAEVHQTDAAMLTDSLKDTHLLWHAALPVLRTSL